MEIYATFAVFNIDLRTRRIKFDLTSIKHNVLFSFLLPTIFFSLALLVCLSNWFKIHISFFRATTIPMNLNMVKSQQHRHRKTCAGKEQKTVRNAAYRICCMQNSAFALSQNMHTMCMNINTHSIVCMARFISSLILLEYISTTVHTAYWINVAAQFLLHIFFFILRSTSGLHKTVSYRLPVIPFLLFSCFFRWFINVIKIALAPSSSSSSSSSFMLLYFIHSMMWLISSPRFMKKSTKDI